MYATIQLYYVHVLCCMHAYIHIIIHIITCKDMHYYLIHIRIHNINIQRLPRLFPGTFQSRDTRSGRSIGRSSDEAVRENPPKCLLLEWKVSGYHGNILYNVYIYIHTDIA